MRQTYLVLMAIALSGVVTSSCTLFAGVSDNVAKAIDRYCDEPQAERQLVRAEVNRALRAQGHTVTVTCAGDVPDTN